MEQLFFTMVPVEDNLENMERVWKLLKRAHAQENFLKIGLGIIKSEKKNFYLKMRKLASDVQMLN